RSFPGHEKETTTRVFSHDGKLLVTGSRDKTVRVWDATTGAEIRRFECGENVHPLALAEGGGWLAAGHGGLGAEIRVWDLRDDSVRHRFNDRTDPDVRCLYLSPDGRYLIPGRSGGGV